MSLLPQNIGEKYSIMKKRSHRKEFEDAMRVEGSEDSKSGSMPRPYTYAIRHTTTDGNIKFYGLSKRKKQYDDV